MMEPNNILTGQLLRQLLEAGYQNLALHYEAINDLNVFPVPDGDTGTNMKITFMSGLDAIGDEKGVGDISTTFARGMLYGARGNSGVLSSQYFSGIGKYLDGKEEVNALEFLEALKEGYKTAYAAAADPAEGTILTVAREGVESISSNVGEHTAIIALIQMVVESMRISLDNTPNLLPILKKSGVVDSGGKGLLTIFEGFLMCLKGEKIQESSEIEEHLSKLPPINAKMAFNENSVLDYGYCTEFLLQLLTSKIKVSEFSIDDFITWLKGHGDSIVCFQTGTIVKVHIHTKKPYEVIAYAQNFGEFVSFKMENMALQHNEVIAKEQKSNEERKKFAVVTIAQGEGLIQLFRDLGADIVLNGGETMNTSTAEMIDAFKEANADEVLLLPNESNIIMAAKQAASLYNKCKVRVVETKTLVEGYSALSMLNPYDLEESYNSFEEARKTTKSAFVALSSRDFTVDGVNHPKGRYIEGVDHKGIIGARTNREEAIEELTSRLPELKKAQILFLIYGENVPSEEAEQIYAKLQKRYPNIEIGLVEGKQKVYDYLVGIQ